MKVAVTCLQLLRDLDDFEASMSEAGCDVVACSVPGQHLEGDELVAALAGCVGVVAGDDQFTRDVLDRLPDMRVISKWGVGTDGIDRQAADERGIVVRNTPGMFDDEVADVAVAYVVSLARQLFQIDRGIRDGEWPKPAGISLRGSTIGIVGLGGIGRAVARRAAIMGMEVVGTDPSPDSREAAASLGVDVVDLHDLLLRSDIVSINCPLTESTFHLLDDKALATVRPGVLVVNTGRGAVVDTGALVRALLDGRVGGAALDVLEEEPPGPEHPLRQFDQVVFGSHNASNTVQASHRVHRLAIQNLLDELELLKA